MLGNYKPLNFRSTIKNTTTNKKTCECPGGNGQHGFVKSMLCQLIQFPIVKERQSVEDKGEAVDAMCLHFRKVSDNFSHSMENAV